MKTTETKILFIVSSLNTIIGLTVQIYFLKIIGIGAKLDAFLIALSFYQFFLTLSNSLITKDLTRQFTTSKYKNQLFSQVLFFSTIITLIVAILIATSIPFFIGIFGPNPYVLSLSRVMIFALIFSNTSNSIAAYLHSLKKHIIPESFSLISFILYCLLILIFFNGNIYNLALIFLGREMFLFILSIFYVRKHISLKGILSPILIEHQNFSKLIGGSLVYKTGPIVDKILLSIFPPGTISILSYSEMAFNSLSRILGKVFEQRLIVKFSTGENYKIKIQYFLFGLTIAIINIILYPPSLEWLTEFFQFQFDAFDQVFKLNLVYSLIIPIMIMQIIESSKLVSKGNFNSLVGFGIVCFGIGLFLKYFLIEKDVGLLSIPLGLLANFIILYLIYSLINQKS